MKRHVISATVVAALMLSAGTTIAAGGGSTTETLSSSDASVTSACSEPARTTITWSATGTWIATRHVNQAIRVNLADGIR